MRARESAKEDQRRARQHVRHFLLRRGRRPDGATRAWTAKYETWLGSVRFEQPALEATMFDYRTEVQHARDRIERLERAIDAAVERAPAKMQAVIAALQALRGIAKVSAVTLVAELGQISRFARPRQLMGYAGVVSGEHSSGESVRRGAITKTGNSHVRRIVGEAAWAYQHQPRVYGALRKRQAGLSEEVKAIAWKAQHRLCGRSGEVPPDRQPAASPPCYPGREGITTPMSEPMRLARAAPRILAFALLACGPGTPPGADADLDVGDGDVDTGIEIAPPALPVVTPCPPGWVEVPADPADPYGYATCDPWPDVGPAVLTPCPPGWREVPPDQPGGVATCDPWPETGHDDCEAVDEAHFPGEPGCVRVGSECPEGDWATTLPADVRILFVRDGEASGGDGTGELPFGTIADAMAEATPGTVIALSKGTFDEAVELETGVTLLGACVAETLVTCSSASSTRATITVEGTNTGLRDLRVSGSRRGISIEGSRYSLSAEEVVVDGAQGNGLHVSGGQALLSNVVVRDTRPSAGGAGGSGLALRAGASLAGSRIAVEGSRGYGVNALGADTSVVLDDASVRQTRGLESDGTAGVGIMLGDGANGSISRVALEQNRAVGVYATAAGTTITLHDVVVRDTLSQESDLALGFGIQVDSGARVEVTRADVARNRTVGASAFGAGTELVLTDIVVRDTERREIDGARGRGLEVYDGARVTVSRAVVERNHDAGLIAFSGDTEVALSDVVVRDTVATGERDVGSGVGLCVQWGARLDASRVVVERSEETGVFVAPEGTTAVLRDLVVRDTAYDSVAAVQGGFGRGLIVQYGAEVEVQRAVFERNGGGGVFAYSDGAAVAMSDVIVRNSESGETDGQGGHGVHVQLGARIDMSRSVVERNQAAGILAIGEGAVVMLHDVVVRDTLESAAGLGGIGITSLGQAHIDVTRFVVTGSVLCGLQLAFGGYFDEDAVFVPFEGCGTMDLHDGEVSENEVCGINVQTPSFDMDRLLDHVIFRDNGVNIDRGNDLYVPTAEPDLELLEE